MTENHTNDVSAAASRLSLASVEQEDYRGRKIPNFSMFPFQHVQMKMITW